MRYVITIVLFGLVSFGVWAISSGEVAWQVTKFADTPESYKEFVDEWGDSKHTDQARQQWARHDLERSRSANSVVALQKHIENFPNQPTTEIARGRISDLRQNESLWPSNVTETKLEKFLVDFPGHALEQRAKEILVDLEGVDVHTLITDGRVSIDASGSSISKVSTKITNLTDLPVRAVIPVGTMFSSGISTYQNMVTTETKSIYVGPGQSSRVGVAVACANRPRKVPHSGIKMTLGEKPTEELGAVLTDISETSLSFAARQAAVWFMTDDATINQLFLLNTMSNDSVVEAIRLVDNHVDIAEKKLWGRQIIELIQKVSDENDAKWLWERINREPTIRNATVTGWTNYYTRESESVIHTAAKRTHNEFLTNLLDFGFDANILSKNGKSPLALAAENKNDHGVALLLERYADANLAGRAGHSPLAGAVKAGLFDTMQLLIEAGATPMEKDGLVHLAAEHSSEILSFLLDEFNMSPDPEFGTAPGRSGDYTPLHLASAESTRILLDRDVRVDVLSQSRFSETALHRSINNTEKLELLLKHGANPNLQDWRGETPLHEAAADGLVNSVSLLIEYEADTRLMNKDGKTPFDRARDDGIKSVLATEPSQ